MAGNTVKEMTKNFGKQDKFKGHDFRRWQKKMHFLLTILKNAESVKELWDSFESRPVMEQFHKLLRILRQYTQHGLKMYESIYISSVIDKLPPSWKEFKHTLKHGKDDLSLVQLGSHLRIEESLRAQESDKGKGKEVVDAIAWWIDSGATTHVCKDRCWFKTYEPVDDGFVLYMGDDHFTHVHGKGSVVLEFSSGKSITLFNVLYVPKLRKNLISGPVLNKCGYKQVYESDKYILSKSGVFVGFGYYKNGMFMLYLNKVLDDSGFVYMSSSTIVNTSLWHARLGHVHYKRMLEISKDDLIPGIIHETTAPYTPQQNGVVERKNRALKEMVNSMLSYSGLSDGFWGEAMAVVRLTDPKRKTFGEKGIDCIFVGYAEQSKAYRFYVIEPNDSVSINTIIESRDAIFDKNRFSSIYRPKDIIPNSDESQRDDHSNDVPSEILEPCKSKRARKAKSYGYDFQLYLVEGSRDQIGSQYVTP
ncbi:zinc finger, CCHC-type containing protein [Tanacetum coccineum]|uniref:Zinc finger, CCHC-type containing protein n=1 Tax=Tanacetum coccineum TaxID=301880 RepID=A0ABQ4WZ11_9ASTR